ncbi:MAG: hypothetical protein ABR955_04215 [Verrucomicrobiota bacterium]|jgi:hypothetical protein
MADFPPSNPGMPTGAVPPKKETGKVQPKKETVRINLPPKPSAAPTIKLPTLPPGGPTGASSAMTASAPAQAASRAAAPVAQARPTPAVQRAAPVTASAISGSDKILAIAAAVAGLFAVGSVLYLWLGISTGN